jgi:hypothetical protein
MFTAKKLRFKSCLSVTLVAVVFSLGYGQSDRPGLVKGNPDTTQHPPDQALLARFEILNKKLSNVKGNYTLAGIININDHANPEAKMVNVKFLFCKHGDDFFYKLGTTATINEQGVYLYIDYQTKRILISEKKQVEYDAGLKSFADLGANIQAEHYKLTSKISGDDETISLINDHHISCKQYSITFERRDMKIKRLFMRLSDINDPLRTDKEKVVDVSISEWDSSAELAKYLSKDNVIKNINGGWKTVNGFKNYRLIKM